MNGWALVLVASLGLGQVPEPVSLRQGETFVVPESGFFLTTPRARAIRTILDRETEKSRLCLEELSKQPSKVETTTLLVGLGLGFLAGVAASLAVAQLTK